MFLSRKSLIQKFISKHKNVQHFLRLQSTISYKSTLLLPQTKFPHKVTAANRRERDRKIENDGKFEKIYKWQESLSNRSQFVLHDGPPYANGDVHIGHAVNKILKDITVRYQLLNGKKVRYIPGWDCHGLPIELKVLKENQAAAYEASKIDIRKRAYTFSQKTKEKQMASFKNWGILADWENSYYTCNPDYIIKQLNMFQQLYEKELIFRDYKPVFWSPHNRTSLAEAELEYNTNHISPSVYVKFAIHQYPDALKSKLEKFPDPKVVIWTTTPWSLPANQAVCYSPDKKYCFAFCKERKETYLVAEVMLPLLEKTLNLELRILETFEGSLLKEFTYVHPINKNHHCMFLASSHVTMDKGTGLVHSAPNHGLEDYTVARKYNLSLDPCLVDEEGCYNNHTIPELKGKEALQSGSQKVLDLLADDILHREDYKHSYPYDWRSKTPVIIRSCHQWFINVQSIKEKALECLENVNVIPDHLKKVFSAQIESSPQWCISRQRAWGIPIPAFYSDETSHPLVHRSLTDHLCSLIQSHGIHSWWEKEVNELIPTNLRNELNLKEAQFKKGSDIMDIWLDSGISWKCVLPDPQVSDVCIEGVDQVRGWFNSSLLTSVALRGQAPYKSLVLHGFTTDSEGRKMSKSEGNVISPEDIISGSKKSGIPAYGIDVLRWFVASHACQSENIAVKMQILEDCSQSINKVRNVLKFLLGSLHQYDPSKVSTVPSELLPLDLFMLHKLQKFAQKINKHYSLVQYKNVAKEILNFVTNDVSSFYCHLVKDSYPWPNLDKLLQNNPLPTSVLLANEIRETILKADVKTPHMKAIISCSSELSEALKELNGRLNDNSGLTEFFQVSEVEFAECPSHLLEDSLLLKGNIDLNTTEHEQFSVAFLPTKLEKCPRCRLYSSNSESTLCDRCANVVSIPSKQSSVV
ncbi:hypothetical protein JTE90_026173 [Oedothorax gibbosus]|uniref:isoleucine--tRNA ligase n=1 Tax=Oedothorax gibbosus TaxID=931172 RepID=A0AAV6UEA5_9ARAC|nr:hypothetical protein JTE90_026173 [Oedothorax gibbosus]